MPELQDFVKVREILRSGIRRLAEAGIPEPELEAAVLLGHRLGISRTALLLSGEREIDGVQQQAYEGDIARRLNREPLAYILEEREFWSLPFKVSRDVLIPRPETEQLIELALGALHGLDPGPRRRRWRVLDLGTGSGVMAAVLALELPAAIVTGVDISFRALQVAAHNARRHKVAGRVRLVNCSWLDGIACRGDYDLVVANPPYIAEHILAGSTGGRNGTLEPEVVRYEPRLALDGGERGLDAIRLIAGDLSRALTVGGWFFMEIGEDQAEEVTTIFRTAATYDRLAVHRDYAGLPRIFQARKM